jgi:hypothetical protein
MNVHAGGFRLGASGSTYTVAVWLPLAAPGMALECPAPQPAGTPDAIQETPAQISELSQLLASGYRVTSYPVKVLDGKILVAIG